MSEQIWNIRLNQQLLYVIEYDVSIRQKSITSLTGGRSDSGTGSLIHLPPSRDF